MAPCKSVRLAILGSLVQDSLEVLCCVLEQDTLSSAYFVLVQLIRKTENCPDMTEKLLTET